jgi:hypothetical protein
MRVSPDRTGRRPEGFEIRRRCFGILPVDPMIISACLTDRPTDRLRSPLASRTCTWMDKATLHSMLHFSRTEWIREDNPYPVLYLSPAPSPSRATRIDAIAAMPCRWLPACLGHVDRRVDRVEQRSGEDDDLLDLDRVKPAVVWSADRSWRSAASADRIAAEQLGDHRPSADSNLAASLPACFHRSGADPSGPLAHRPAAPYRAGTHQTNGLCKLQPRARPTFPVTFLSAVRFPRVMIHVRALHSCCALVIMGQLCHHELHRRYPQAAATIGWRGLQFCRERRHSHQTIGGKVRRKVANIWAAPPRMPSFRYPAPSEGFG